MSTAETAEARPTSLAKTGASLEPDRSARTRALSLVAQQFFADWRREWTVGRGADRLPAGGYHKATGWDRLGKDTERADREEDDDGDNPRDPDDDANGDHTHLMQTQMGGSSSSGERETVPQGCLAGAWKLPTPPSGRSADGGHC